jgi:chromosome segregation ATPase
MADATQAPDQQAQPTGDQQDAGQTPDQQAQSQTQQQQPPAQQQQQQSGADWHNRYNGLQQVHQQTVEELRRAQALLQQNQQHAGTLEQQLQQTQGERGELQQSVEQMQQELSQLRQENEYRSLLQSEYPELLPFANVLQRAADPDAQREILENARQAMGSQVQQQATQTIQQQFEGVTPGVAPQVGQQGGVPQYDKAHVLEQLDRHRPGTPEYERWKTIWENHPENTPLPHHQARVQELMSDWDYVRQPEEMRVIEDNTRNQGPWGSPSPYGGDQDSPS